MSFANATSVSPVKTQEDIRKTLVKYGATGFVFGEANGQAICGFEMKHRRIKFVIELPIHGKAKSKKNWLMTKEQCEQKVRTNWRCLLLAIKAKLECAESGISTFEQEFLAHIVMPNGQTVGHILIPQIDESYDSKNMPPLLGGRT